MAWVCPKTGATVTPARADRVLHRQDRDRRAGDMNSSRARDGGAALECGWDARELRAELRRMPQHGAPLRGSVSGLRRSLGSVGSCHRQASRRPWLRGTPVRPPVARFRKPRTTVLLDATHLWTSRSRSRAELQAWTQLRCEYVGLRRVEEPGRRRHHVGYGANSRQLRRPVEKPDAAGAVTRDDSCRADGDRRVRGVAAMSEEAGVGLEVPNLQRPVIRSRDPVRWRVPEVPQLGHVCGENRRRGTSEREHRPGYRIRAPATRRASAGCR